MTCTGTKKFDYIIAIENGIDDHFEDRAFVVVIHNGKTFVGHSFGLPVPVSIRGLLTNQELQKAKCNENCTGYYKTAGEFISEQYPRVDHNNWHKMFGMNRLDQIVGGITNTLSLLF